MFDFFHKKIKVFALVTNSNIPEHDQSNPFNTFYVLIGIGKLIGLLIVLLLGFNYIWLLT